MRLTCPGIFLSCSIVALKAVAIRLFISDMTV